MSLMLPGRRMGGGDWWRRGGSQIGGKPTSRGLGNTRALIERKVGLNLALPHAHFVRVSTLPTGSKSVEFFYTFRDCFRGTELHHHKIQTQLHLLTFNSDIHIMKTFRNYRGFFFIKFHILI
jgi:hypothetical protein